MTEDRWSGTGRYNKAWWAPHSSTAQSNALYILSASDDVRPSKRVGRRSDVSRKTHTAAHKSQSPARRRRRRELAERKTRVAAVVARNCNSARERRKAQSYLCRRLSAKQFQTRMQTQPMPSRNIFFP